MDDFFLQIILLLSYSEVNIEIDFHCLIIHIIYRYLGRTYKSRMLKRITSGLRHKNPSVPSKKTRNHQQSNSSNLLFNLIK